MPIPILALVTVRLGRLATARLRSTASRSRKATPFRSRWQPRSCSSVTSGCPSRILGVVKVPLTPANSPRWFPSLMTSARGSPTKPGFSSSTLLKKLNTGDYNAVPAQLACWVNNHGATMQGLVNRRAAEAGLRAKGEFVASAPVPAKLKEERRDATHSNQIWAMDFVHDQLATGRKLRILTIVDTHSRYAPATDPRFSYRGEDVVQTLERVCQEVGYPKMIRVDNGSEFISRDLDLWAYQREWP